MAETAAQKSSGHAPRRGAATSADTEDQEYALVSVLYNALQGVQACDQYLIDAERAGDEELMKFFVESREEQTRCANRAMALVSTRIESTEDEDEE